MNLARDVTKETREMLARYLELKFVLGYVVKSKQLKHHCFDEDVVTRQSPSSSNEYRLALFVMRKPRSALRNHVLWLTIDACAGGEFQATIISPLLQSINAFCSACEPYLQGSA